MAKWWGTSFKPRHYDLVVDPYDDVEDDFEDDFEVIEDGHSQDPNLVQGPPSASSTDRYKRRVEHRSSTPTPGRGTALAVAGVVIAGVAGLLLWLQPWNSTPLEITSVESERVELVERAGADACFWRFSIEIANNADERVWITAVELFLNNDPVRPDNVYGIIEPDVASAIPIEIYVGQPNAGQCLTTADVSHSAISVRHATIGDGEYTARKAF